MGTGRLEAFSDGVLAIVITIMVLELPVPRGQGLATLAPLLPAFLSYVLSFIYVGIYWNNHHHMLQVTRRINGAVLWANLHLLFWLSLIPFVTAWTGENQFAPIPTAAYGVVLMMAAVAYLVLERSILAVDGPDSPIAAAVSHSLKELLSPALYLLAIPLALVRPWIAGAIYVTVALIWLRPDRRIERIIAAAGDDTAPSVSTESGREG